jgi:O-acetylserine/cysteine efflux transporter
MPSRHAALAAAVAVVWGVNFVVIDVGLESFPPLLFAALRFTLVALPGLLLVGRPRVPWRWVLAVGVFICTGQFGLLFVGMHEGLPAGLASLILQLQVVFTIGLAALLLGERPSARQAAGALVALAGMGVIAAGRSADVPLFALLLGVAAALSWAIGNVCTRRAQAPDALALIVWASLVPPIPLALLSLALEDHGAISVDAGGVLALLYVVVGATAFGFGAWTWLISRHRASQVVPFALLVPPAGIASAWVFLGETPNGAELAGALVVLAGLAVAVLPAARLTRRTPAVGAAAG